MNLSILLLVAVPLVASSVMWSPIDNDNTDATAYEQTNAEIIERDPAAVEQPSGIETIFVQLNPMAAISNQVAKRFTSLLRSYMQVEQVEFEEIVNHLGEFAAKLDNAAQLNVGLSHEEKKYMFDLEAKFQGLAKLPNAFPADFKPAANNLTAMVFEFVEQPTTSLGTSALAGQMVELAYNVTKLTNLLKEFEKMPERFAKCAEEFESVQPSDSFSEIKLLVGNLNELLRENLQHVKKTAVIPTVKTADEEKYELIAKNASDISTQFSLMAEQLEQIEHAAWEMAGNDAVRIKTAWGRAWVQAVAIKTEFYRVSGQSYEIENAEG